MPVVGPQHHHRWSGRQIPSRRPRPRRRGPAHPDRHWEPQRADRRDRRLVRRAGTPGRSRGNCRIATFRRRARGGAHRHDRPEHQTLRHAPTSRQRLNVLERRSRRGIAAVPTPPRRLRSCPVDGDPGPFRDPIGCIAEDGRPVHRESILMRCADVGHSDSCERVCLQTGLRVGGHLVLSALRRRSVRRWEVLLAMRAALRCRADRRGAAGCTDGRT